MSHFSNGDDNFADVDKKNEEMKNATITEIQFKRFRLLLAMIENVVVKTHSAVFKQC